jgi:DNA-binding IclR family transcriptional regulator
MTAKTVEKGLLLLELFARSAEPRALADLVRELRMPKSNVYRLLNALVAHRYLRRRPQDRRYELTLKLWELGNQSTSQANITQVARPALDKMSAAAGESGQLAVLDEGESVFIDKVDGRHPVSGFTRVGSRAPAYCCATGKAQLAYQAPEVVKRAAAAMRRQTAATLTTLRALERDLAEIRERGYAVNRGEWYEDVWGVAAPIRNRDGTVCASVGVWGPKHRVSRSIPAAARAVIEAAANISTALGHRPTCSDSTKQRRSS